MSKVVLKVAGVSKRFGGLQALSDVGITINEGQVYGLIGPNGAGKTTFFNVITGLYTPDSGTFELGGAPYKPEAVHQVAKAGIDAAVGVIDVKSYYIETPDDVAARIRACLKYAPPERLVLAPDCGLSQTARWAARPKLANMVAGARQVRKELGL